MYTYYTNYQDSNLYVNCACTLLNTLMESKTFIVNSKDSRFSHSCIHTIIGYYYMSPVGCLSHSAAYGDCSEESFPK